MTDLMNKCRALARQRFPQGQVVAPSPLEVMLQKWGHLRVDPVTARVKDPTVMVVVAVPQPPGTPQSLGRRVVIVDLDRDLIVGESG